MVFSSLNFLFLFLPAVVLLYYTVPEVWKNFVLLIASLLFYAWGEPVYLVLLLLSIAFNYVAGLLLESIKSSKVRSSQLVLAVTINIGLLGVFKYSGLVIDTVNHVTHWNIANQELELPIGISFYTFQAVSYIVDVYRGKCRAQRSLLKFALYITMFPQLVAGPIVKYADIEAQLTKRTISMRKSARGVERLIWGLSKKVLLANNLGALHSALQQLPTTTMNAWLGALAYTLQIYFDFSGYSDMAIGMGEIFGFRFRENFQFPYTADSVTDFWRRWHITLSDWFREYIYIPLGGNRRSVIINIRNLMIVWFLTGLWHGAQWNFVLWGAYYGVLLVFEKYVLGFVIKRLPQWLRHIYTLLFIVVGWVIFSNQTAVLIPALQSLFGRGSAGFVDASFVYYLRSNAFLLLLGGFAATPLLKRSMLWMSGKIPALYAGMLLTVFVLDIAFLVEGTYNPFLYFQF